MTNDCVSSLFSCPRAIVMETLIIIRGAHTHTTRHLPAPLSI